MASAKLGRISGVYAQHGCLSQEDGIATCERPSGSVPGRGPTLRVAHLSLGTEVVNRPCWAVSGEPPALAVPSLGLAGLGHCAVSPCAAIRY